MPAKPQITIGSDNQTPTTATQQADANWAQPTGSGDGYHATVGAKADAAATDTTSSWSLVALLKGILARLLGTLSVALVGRNTQVGADLTAAWANSATAGTQQNVDAALPATLQPNAQYVVIIRNPSAVTALSVQAKLQANALDGGTRYPSVTAWSVAPGVEVATVVSGWLLGNGGRLTLRNDTALGAADGFTATVRVIQV